MKYATRLLIGLSIAAITGCNVNNNEQAKQHKLDSTRRVDSISAVMEKRRIIDSIQMVNFEQEIIADSIMNQVNKED